MNKRTIVEFKNVTKTFVFNPDRAVSLKQAAVNLVTLKKPASPKTFTALTDISFSIGAGEFVGILGRNGAGKSTTLKLMAHVLSPSKGTVRVNGRVAPLIELGAGFHPDLTGLENIFLNGSIIGLTKEDIYNKLDRIIDFSELGAFIDMPVRQYSSGMFLRLGFSVAIHTAPDILLVDEVLAVGDASFQNKCRTRIRQLHEEGVTIVLISHLADEISDFCDRCILIEDGKIAADGDTQNVLSRYTNSILDTPLAAQTSPVGEFPMNS